jgi:dGTPase
MDVADDIAYSTYDLEDAFKSGFLDPLEIVAQGGDALAKFGRIAEKLNSSGEKTWTAEKVGDALFDLVSDEFRPMAEVVRDEYADADSQLEWQEILHMGTLFRAEAQSLAADGYRRMNFTSTLVGHFVEGIRVDVDDEFPSQSRVYLEPRTRELVDVLKTYVYVSVIESPRLRIPEYRGFEIVSSIFRALIEDGGSLLPDDFRAVFKRFQGDEPRKHRLVADFIAGMTDQYAMTFYNRLASDIPETIFGPSV